MIGGPAEIRLDRDGHLYIQIQNRLIEHDADGEYVETHDLSLLGVEQFLGNFDFFSNGDILLRRGPDPRSFYDNIRAFQRKTNHTSLQPLTPGSGMSRCSLKTLECRQFGENGIDFKSAFGIVITGPADEVYVSDTSRHLLRKYSAAGAPLSDPVDGFMFPNQILIEDGQLFVTDTNNHRVRVVDPGTAKFGKTIASHYVTPESAVREDRRWPSHIARVGDEWWVNNMRTGMNEGGIYIFDDNWGFDRMATLPQDADPISLIAFRGEVLVTDWNNDRVHRVAATGELLGAFESPGLEKVLKDSVAARATFEFVSYSGVFLLALVFGGMLVRALVVAISPESANKVDDQATETSVAANEPLQLKPNPKVVRKASLSIRIAGIMIGVAATMITYIASSHPEGSTLALKLLLPGCAMLAFFVLIAWLSRANSKSAIGVHGETLTLRNHSGQESTCSIRDASYDKTVVATRDMAVFLGQSPAAFYDREILEEHLFPRLADAKKLSTWQMQMLLIKLRHPQGLVTVFSLLAMLLYAAWTWFAETA